MEDYSDDPVTRSPSSRRNAVIVLIVLVIVAAIAWFATHRSSATGAGAGRRQAGAGGGGAGGPGGPGGFGGGRRQAATVGTAKVVGGNMPETLAAIGTVTPMVTATVRPQLAGNIFTINFTEGQVVRQGQLLAQIDPRPYRLALAQAEANLQRDLAQLNLAQVTLKRYQTLLSQDSIAKQDVDTQAASLNQYQGTVAADRAAIGSAKLNLQYTSITSPVSGRVGLRQVDIGNYVTTASSIAIITQTAPIDVAFSLPQADLQRLLAKRSGGDGLPVTATDQTGQTTLAQGRFLTFDNQIDATTGTVKAKARFPNGDGKLFPNQFVNVALLADTLQHVATVPVTAVRHGAQGDFVFTLTDKKTAKLQVVKLGPGDGAKVAILSGVAIGETVITEGADNLDDGSPVVLPGDTPAGFNRQRSQGFFARLFGWGGSSGSGTGERRRRAEQAQDGGDNAAAAQGGADNASGAAGQHRRRRAESAGQ